MFASDLSFSKAIITERTHRAPRRSLSQRIFRLEGSRPGTRQAGGR